MRCIGTNFRCCGRRRKARLEDDNNFALQHVDVNRNAEYVEN